MVPWDGRQCVIVRFPDHTIKFGSSQAHCLPELLVPNSFQTLYIQNTPLAGKLLICYVKMLNMWLLVFSVSSSRCGSL